ncbi:hypothetical protein [Candidatus Sororendozoicomonas aggregata]|uniref:hypothetical protein n=1 Tax=Candidatus Sororendozoicomonas aggregata TaxID=3073239 RepID=UPI002ED5C994
MINDLSIDPIEEGTCILDVNRFLLYNYTIDPCLNHFFYHVCSIGNPRTDYINPLERNKPDFLIEKLETYYKKDHPVFLISSSIDKNNTPDVKKSVFSKLRDLLKNVSFKHTLFIPAVLPKKEKINNEFFSHIYGESLNDYRSD